MEGKVLSVKDLKISIGGQVVVEDLAFQLAPRETLALVGESGSGKTLSALALLKLLPEVARLSMQSKLFVDGEDLRVLSERGMRKIRGRRVAMIFQEPMLALNPVLTIGQQILEVLRIHTPLDERAARKRMETVLHAVGLTGEVEVQDRYPHQLSGGMRQRAMIAMAISTEPEILVADEPTTALDVTIQAQILVLLKELQSKYGMAMLFITHDLAVVRQVADRVAVMYQGRIVESATVDQFFKGPNHPYTQALFHALPEYAKRGQALATSPHQTRLRDSKCAFAPRCTYAKRVCDEVVPELHDKGGHIVYCHRMDELKELVTTGVNLKPLAAAAPSEEILLSFNNIEKTFYSSQSLFGDRHGFKALKGVSCWIHPGETLAIVGESGSGKTTLAKILVGLLDRDGGEVEYRGLRPDEVQIIFQDPHTSMNPKWRVEAILSEGLAARGLYPNRKDRRVYLTKLLRKVGLDSEHLDRYPHAFSGGQKQRLAIARALSVGPKLIVCDEPTSALDVSVQAQILNLLKQLQTELGMAYIFISHSMSVVSYLADRVMVMKAGEVVEEGSAEDVLLHPKHPYTQVLLESVPDVDRINVHHVPKLYGDSKKLTGTDYYVVNE